MLIIKVLFRIFVILPIVAMSSCAAGGYIAGGGTFNLWAAVIASLIASISYLVWDGKQNEAKFAKHAASLGVNPEYVGCYFTSGIAIDKTNEKLFAGEVGKGRIFEFNEISSIAWEDYPLGDSMKYMIKINTKNFDLPQLIVGFGGTKHLRDESYAKLRAALNIS